MNRILRREDFREMPWKNGLGTTTEMYRKDQDGSMVFRVSSAAVEASGPFSDFDGYDRTLVNLGPGVMWLSHDGSPEASLNVNQCVHFDGSAKTTCRIERATRDLNIFCAKDKYFASTIVRALKGPEFLPLPQGTNALLYLLAGSMVVQNAAKREFHVGMGEGLLCEESALKEQERWMLASASEEQCVYAAIVFRKLASDDNS